MNHPKVLKIISLAGTLLILTACGSKIRYPSFYALNLPAPTPHSVESRPLSGSVAVHEFSAPRFLRAGPIVYRPSPEQLGFYNYNRWAVDPRHAVTSGFVQALASRGIFQSVRMFDGSTTPEYLITGTLDHLEEVDREHQVLVNVAISAQLINIKTGDVVWRDTSSQIISLEKRAMVDLVSGMSQSTDQVITNLISSMQERLRQLEASYSLDVKGAGQE